MFHSRSVECLVICKYPSIIRKKPISTLHRTSIHPAGWINELKQSSAKNSPEGRSKLKKVYKQLTHPYRINGARVPANKFLLNCELEEFHPEISWAGELKFLKPTAYNGMWENYWNCLVFFLLFLWSWRKLFCCNLWCWGVKGAIGILFCFEFSVHFILFGVLYTFRSKDWELLSEDSKVSFVSSTRVIVALYRVLQYCLRLP